MAKLQILVPSQMFSANDLRTVFTEKFPQGFKTYGVPHIFLGVAKYGDQFLQGYGWFGEAESVNKAQLSDKMSITAFIKNNVIEIKAKTFRRIWDQEEQEALDRGLEEMVRYMFPVLFEEFQHVEEVNLEEKEETDQTRLGVSFFAHRAWGKQSCFRFEWSWEVLKKMEEGRRFHRFCSRCNKYEECLKKGEVVGERRKVTVNV